MDASLELEIESIAKEVGVGQDQVQRTLELLDAGNTIPFITRYRKDETGGLDEQKLRDIRLRANQLRALQDRKATILKSIEGQGKLTDELRERILKSRTSKALEDHYLPFKPRKQTLATQARQKGLAPLARDVMDGVGQPVDLATRALEFVRVDKGLAHVDDVMTGVRHLLAEELSESAELRRKLRGYVWKHGQLICTGIEASRPSSEVSAAEDTVSRDSNAKEVSSEKPKTPTASVAHELVDPNESPNVTKTEELDDASTLKQETQDETSRGRHTEPQSDASVVTDSPSSASTEQVASSGSEIEDPVSQAPPEVDADAKPTEGAQASSAKGAVSSSGDPKKTQHSIKSKGKKAKSKKPKRDPFESYRDFKEAITKVPPHRVLAINRGERARALRVRIEVEFDPVLELAQTLLIPDDHAHRELLLTCVRDALQRLVLPALEREIRRELTEKAEQHAIEVFARNLRHLLLQRPVRGFRVLAIDPGFKSGCKLVCLDEFGNIVGHGIFFIVGSSDRIEQSRQKLIDMIREHQIKVIAIGNGTACRQSEKLVAELLENQLKDDGISYVIVNEAGASVYSTSNVGREELPNHDPTIRSAASIGRRLLDPLSELVKISAANIGVGLYQHDVKAKHLQESLDEVVASCVNFVGVDVNTASPSLLRYVSGLNQLTARRIVEYRTEHGPLKNRDQLKEVQGIGGATFVQAAGFLRVTGGDEPLDATWIHPESYAIARDVLKRMGMGDEVELKQAVEETSTKSDSESSYFARAVDASLDIQEVANELETGVMRLADIVHDLQRPGRDPREDLPAPIFRRGIVKFEDLEPGMELSGRVLNVVDFGVFVDIGVGDSGLIHISKLSDRYVSDPHDVASVGDLIHVWVIDVDKNRRRVSLSAIPEDRRLEMQRSIESRRAHKTAGARAHRQDARGRRGKAGNRDVAKRSGRKRTKPPRPPAPAKPITKAMVEGRKPMRSFSDLKQFFDIKDQSDPDTKKN